MMGWIVKFILTDFIDFHFKDYMNTINIIVYCVCIEKAQYVYGLYYCRQLPVQTSRREIFVRHDITKFVILGIIKRS